MTYSTIRTLAHVGLVLACALAPSSVASGQGPSTQANARRELVVLAIDSAFAHEGTDAVVVRRANLVPHDIVVLRPGKASASQIAAAVAVLHAARARDGDVAPADVVLRVGEHKVPQSIAARANGWAERLEKTTGRSRIPGLGSMVNIAFWLVTEPTGSR